MALAQTIERDVIVPGWVPPEFRAIYRLVATTRSEEDAAALARKLKAADGESGWTGGRLAILVSMWADGRSAAQISEAIGGGITRAAVIGKLHRLHLADDMRDRPKRVAAAPKAKLVVVPKVADKPVVTSPEPRPKPIAPAIAPAPPPKPAPEGGVGFFELRAHVRRRHRGAVLWRGTRAGCAAVVLRSASGAGGGSDPTQEIEGHGIMSASIDPIELLHPSPDVADRMLDLLHDLTMRRLDDPLGASREALAMVLAGLDHIRVADGSDAAQHAINLLSAENERIVLVRDAAIISDRRTVETAMRQARRSAP